MTTTANNPVSPAEVLREPSLPQSREAEMALLGAMVLDNDVIGDVVELVNQREMFAYPTHRPIFEAILQLHMEHKPIDLVILRDALQRDRKLDSVGGADYLMTLVEKVPSSAGALTYADTVREKFVLRNIIETCTKIVQKATQETENVDEVREAAEKAIFQALSRGEKGAVRTMTDVLQAAGFVWRGVVPLNKGRGARAPHKGYFRHQCEYVVWGTNGRCRKAEHAGPFEGCIAGRVRKCS